MERDTARQSEGSTAPTVRAAVVQMDVRVGEPDGNLARVLERLEQAAAQGARLIVFPECALSGYCFDDPADAVPLAEAPASDRLARFAARCVELDVTGVLGYLEGGAECPLGNAALVATPDGATSIYRKTHLPTLGVDRYVTPGESLAAVPAPFGRLGVLVCYDIRFPEAARCLALDGADILALPTNWPEGAESSPDFITRARAWENRLWVLAANRVGVERGRRFIGRSQIVSPAGQIVAEAGPEEEAVLLADLDLTPARQKRIVIEPGAWELDPFGDRRPELYGRLVCGADAAPAR